MPATPERIAFVREEWRRVRAQSPDVQTRHGSLARESDDPVETFFDDPADALAVATERQALLGGERRLFPVAVAGVDTALGIDYLDGSIPLADFLDAEKQADGTGLIADIGFDFAKQRSTFSIWG